MVSLWIDLIEDLDFITISPPKACVGVGTEKTTPGNIFPFFSNEPSYKIQALVINGY